MAWLAARGTVSAAAHSERSPQEPEDPVSDLSPSPSASLAPGDTVGALRVVRVIDPCVALAIGPERSRPAVLVHWSGATETDARALTTPPDAPRHPHWLPILDVVEHDGIVLVHAAVAGPTLETFRQRLHLTLTQVDALARQLIAAVESAHRLERVVGALEPRTVWLAREGHDIAPYVVGVGLTDALPEPERYVVETVSTPFVAPEVRDGRVLSLAADRYALGAVLHQLVTGHAPGPGGPTGLDELPERMRLTIEGCLEPDPAARPLDVLSSWTRGRPMPTGAWDSDMLARLNRLGPHLPHATVADPQPRASSAPNAAPDSRLPAIATGALLATLAGLSAWCAG